MKRNLLVSIKIRRQPPQTLLLKDVLMFDSLWEHSAAVLPYMAVGFGAQMVDGALGMAFGVISNTLLLTLGVPPAAASAGVHTISEERRVWKECVSTCRSRWSPSTYKKK